MSFEARVADILVSRGVLAPGALERASQAAAERELRLGEALLHLRLLDPATLLEVTSEHLGMRFAAELDVEEIDVDLTLELPVTFAKQQLLLPLYRSGGQVLVAVGDPLNVDALDALQLMLGYPTEPVVVPEMQLLDAINKVYDRGPGLTDALAEDAAEAARLRWEEAQRSFGAIAGRPPPW